jgi:RNA polymerase sigma factor (sigma-70 family)
MVPQSSLDEVIERPSGDTQPEQSAVQRSDLTRLRQLLALLSDERADALSLRFFSQLSLAEVAQVMDKSEAAVKMLVYRGLQELRDRFGPVVLEELLTRTFRLPVRRALTTCSPAWMQRIQP